jgi:hypothetical protein
VGRSTVCAVVPVAVDEGDFDAGVEESTDVCCVAADEVAGCDESCQYISE